jgi:hypothetical protein
MRTKFTSFILFLLLGVGTSMFLLSSCAKLKEATTFKIKYDLPDMNYTIDSLSLLKTEMALYSQSYSINIDSIAGASNGLVERASFYKMRFSVVTPESAKLNWLNSARITVTPDGGSPVDIATSGTINATENFIDFQVNDYDMFSAMKKPFLITVYGNLNGTIPDLPMKMLMESGLEITMSPF